jgi:uncharacterized protein DUF3347
MRPTYIVITCCLIALYSCNSGTSTKTGTTDSTKMQAKTAREPAKSRLNATGTALLLAVVNKYYALKDALVATKASRADSAAAGLAVMADSLQSFLLKDTSNKIALKPFLDTVIAQSKLVTEAKDETCEKKRLAFGSVSSGMYGLVKTADLKNAGIYHEYCPMAFNEKGASWLSDDADIKNPYFGKKMMECGEVTDSL